MEAARRESIIPKHAHGVMAPQQAVDLLSDYVGIAILRSLRQQAFMPTVWS